MKNLVELIEKPVFSLKDFCIIGKVTGCLVDHDFVSMLISAGIAVAGVFFSWFRGPAPDRK